MLRIVAFILGLAMVVLKTVALSLQFLQSKNLADKVEKARSICALNTMGVIFEFLMLLPLIGRFDFSQSPYGIILLKTIISVAASLTSRSATGIADVKITFAVTFITLIKSNILECLNEVIYEAIFKISGKKRLFHVVFYGLLHYAIFALVNNVPFFLQEIKFDDSRVEGTIPSLITVCNIMGFDVNRVVFYNDPTCLFGPVSSHGILGMENIYINVKWNSRRFTDEDVGVLIVREIGYVMTKTRTFLVISNFIIYAVLPIVFYYYCKCNFKKEVKNKMSKRKAKNSRQILVVSLCVMFVLSQFILPIFRLATFYLENNVDRLFASMNKQMYLSAVEAIDKISYSMNLLYSALFDVPLSGNNRFKNFKLNRETFFNTVGMKDDLLGGRQWNPINAIGWHPQAIPPVVA